LRNGPTQSDRRLPSSSDNRGRLIACLRHCPSGFRPLTRWHCPC
jgi:hypothetical protein